MKENKDIVIEKIVDELNLENIGSTTLASHEAKLVAVTAITNRGFIQLLANATVTYIVKK